MTTTATPRKWKITSRELSSTLSDLRDDISASALAPERIDQYREALDLCIDAVREIMVNPRPRRREAPPPGPPPANVVSLRPAS